jgi:hypothetical protein
LFLCIKSVFVVVQSVAIKFCVSAFCFSMFAPYALLYNLI